MKIAQQDTVNTITNSQPNGVFDAAKATAENSRPSQSANVSVDGIDLGNQSGLVSQALTAGADSNAERIEQLRSLVQSGQYQVDPAALSRSIVDATLNGL